MAPCVEDNLEEFKVISDEEAAHFGRQAEQLFNETTKAIMLNFSGLSFGNIARVPGPDLRKPARIRDIEDWYISLSTRRDFVLSGRRKSTWRALKNFTMLSAIMPP